MITICPYNCENKTLSGYCKTTACINPKYQGTRTIKIEPQTQGITVRVVEVSEESIERIADAVVRKLEERNNEADRR